MGQGRDCLRIFRTRAGRRSRGRLAEDPRRRVGQGPVLFLQSGSRRSSARRSMVKWRQSTRRAHAHHGRAPRGPRQAGRERHSTRLADGDDRGRPRADLSLSSLHRARRSRLARRPGLHLCAARRWPAGHLVGPRRAAGSRARRAPAHARARRADPRQGTARQEFRRGHRASIGRASSFRATPGWSSIRSRRPRPPRI